MSARVKSVLSGDTLVLVDKPSTGETTVPGVEHQLTLAYLTAPRLSEPWGFGAREFLRLLLLAKPVKYVKLYEANGREFGDASSPVFRSLVQHVLAHGWAKLRDDYLSKPGAAALQEQLESAQAEAQSQRLGIWSDKRPVRINQLESVPADVYGSGRRIPAIVERVLGGDRIVLRAMLSDTEHYVGPANLAGIRTHTNNGSNEVAANLVATRLLQRQNVRAVFVVPAPHNLDIPLVNLLHPQGDIALVLASSGLAEVPNLPQIGTERLLQLRNAQREAEQKGLGIFQAAAQARKDHKAAYAGQSHESRVIKVISGDTYVLDPGMKTVQLSSVRAPRRTEQIGDKPPGFYVNDAKEFARKLLIGQTVRIQVDGETSFPPPANDPNAKPEQRPLVTMSYGPQFASNAALTIIKAGWATATRHRRDDLARSPFYDELEAAEKSAEAAKLGIFQSTDSSKSRKPNSKAASGQMVYASESVVRARGYLASLERKSRIPAIVDQVVSAGRLRLVLPSENCSLMAVLDGVKVPRTTEPYGEEAMLYTLREWNQRDVQVSVRAVDKTGAFVAAIYHKSKELARELLANGLASVHAGSANASGLRAEYDELEQAAQLEHQGMWAHYEPEAPVPTESLDGVNLGEGEVTEGSADGAPGTVQYRDAVLAFATPDNVFVRFAAQDAQFKQLERDLRQFFTAASNTAARSFTKRPKRRDTVVIAATYERAVITNMSRGDTNTFDLELLDSGEQKSHVPLRDLLPIPPQFNTLPGLATAVQLRYVHRPVSLYTKRYIDYLQQRYGKPIVVAGDILYPADSANVYDSLNFRLVANGLASVPQAQAHEENAQPYLEAQQKVKDERQGMWEYGDPREDDDM